jgi:hypothetical protein
MKLTSKLSTGLIVFAFFFALLALPASAVFAQDQEIEENAETQNELEEEQDVTEEDEAEREDNGVVYEYVAQPGDSYALVARKAVQTYGLKEEVSLSQAQIIYAETHLTLNADSPGLTVGQEVTVDESDVADVVGQAQELSEEQEAAWNAYVRFADFNTDNVGEVR